MGIIRTGARIFWYLLVFSVGYYLGGGCERERVKEKIRDAFSYQPPAHYETIDERLTSGYLHDVNGIEHMVSFSHDSNGNSEGVRT